MAQISYSGKFGPTPPVSVAVFRALQLGDLLVAVPAFRALKKGLPGARITLVGLPWARSFVERYSMYLDDFLEFPGYPGLSERPADIHAVPAFFTQAQRSHFDLAIQLHGSGSYVNSITVLLGARRTAGYYLPGEYCPDPELFMVYPEGEHEIRRSLRLMEFLGLPPAGDELEFPVILRDEKDFAQLPGAGLLVPHTYVCVHPGARLRSRRWLPERFAAVADAIAARGYRVVLTGTREEAALVQNVRDNMKTEPLMLAGKTTLGALALLVRQAAFLISNDTGISHIAAAVGTPSIVVTMGSDPRRWQPLRKDLHRLVIVPIDCRPCYYDECPIGHPCATGISVESVLEAVDHLTRSQAVASRL